MPPRTKKKHQVPSTPSRVTRSWRGALQPRGDVLLSLPEVNEVADTVAEVENNTKDKSKNDLPPAPNTSAKTNKDANSNAKYLIDLLQI